MPVLVFPPPPLRGSALSGRPRMRAPPRPPAGLVAAPLWLQPLAATLASAVPVASRRSSLV
eukprot:9452798-Pyramimonas_sp.AAC.1